MISYQIIEHGRPLQKVMHETPKPTGTEVLVRITRSGVCHSDVHIWDGYFDWGGGKRFYVKERGCVPPFTLGHEPFGVKGGLAAGVKFIESAQFMSHLANIGDTRTLIIHPASTTHRQLDEAQQRAAGVLPDMIRMSVGLEHIDDILWDIDQALAAAGD